MSRLRQALYAIALAAALALLFWGLAQERKANSNRLKLSNERLANAEQRLAEQVADNQLLAKQLEAERHAQQQLAQQTQGIRQALADRQTQIKELTRENEQLRQWAAVPLPDVMRSLHNRPALTGAKAYREWLSRSHPLRVTGDQPP